MRDGAEHVEREFASVRGCIEAFLEAHEVDAAALDAGDDREEFLEGAPEPVDPGDAEAIAGPCVIEQFGESGSLEALAGDDVGEHTERPGFDQALALGVETLVCGRDADVAQGVALPGGVPRRSWTPAAPSSGGRTRFTCCNGRLAWRPP